MKIIKQIKQVKRSVIAVIALAGTGLGLLFALPATEVLHAFSTNEFCGSCHTMQPMLETFEQSIHGGNNSQGFVAECVDCHLPKSNVVEQLYVKGTSGMRHLWGEYVKGMDALDYQANHEKRTEFVFDSGCENCHRTLEHRASIADEQSAVSDQVHQMAFANRDTDTDYQCSSCHYDIAHPNLKRNMRLREEEKIRELAAVGGL
ncbi:cytochrome C [Photobacterium gaetbulicola]|uniref:Cytochrome c-type protein n=1 Tax=Photobacterium gaetbulicola TaxID=1295392 RepID=A0A0B9G9E0_9GAMM|nr:NapC/NirT family cytochrome c [Photobacterium gaetbulicola]KHT65323.1 cytochrome C [Photobacterium gaetbulicola]